MDTACNPTQRSIVHVPAHTTCLRRGERLQGPQSFRSSNFPRAQESESAESARMRGDLRFVVKKYRPNPYANAVRSAPGSLSTRRNNHARCTRWQLPEHAIPPLTRFQFLAEGVRKAAILSDVAQPKSLHYSLPTQRPLHHTFHDGQTE